MNDHQVIPNYQPILDRHGAVFAYEAFMRLKGDASKSARFVPRWERSRLIAIADNAMVEEVSKLACQSSYRGNMHFCLNISPVSIDADPRALAQRLGLLRTLSLGVTAEVSHITAQRNFPRFVEFVGLCKHRKVGIALEDVRLETPFASRRFLESVHPEFVKIDSGYLARIAGTPEHAEMLHYAEMVQTLGTRIIVKNIECADGNKAAKLLGAHLVQGRYFAIESPAVPPPAPTQSSPAKTVLGAQPCAGARLARSIDPSHWRVPA